MHLSSSRFRVVFFIPQCVLVQTSVIQRCELGRLDILTTSFKVYFADVDVAGSSVVTVIPLGRSRFNVRQLWDDQHRFKQILSKRRLGSAPSRFTHALQQSVVVSLLFLALVSRIERRMSQSHP